MAKRVRLDSLPMGTRFTNHAYPGEVYTLLRKHTSEGVFICSLEGALPHVPHSIFAGCAEVAPLEKK